MTVAFFSLPNGPFTAPVSYVGPVYVQAGYNDDGSPNMQYAYQGNLPGYTAYDGDGNSYTVWPTPFTVNDADGNAVPVMTHYAVALNNWYTLPNGVEVFSYDSSVYPSPMLAYLDNLEPQGNQKGLAKIVTALGVDPNAVLLGLRNWLSMSSDDTVGWLGSPVAFLQAAAIGNPAIMDQVADYIQANQAQFNAGQSLTAKQWVAMHPSQSMHTSDYVELVIAAVSVAMPAILAAYGGAAAAIDFTGVDATGIDLAVSPGEGLVAYSDVPIDFTGVDASGIDTSGLDLSTVPQTDIPPVDSPVVTAGETSGDISTDAGGTSGDVSADAGGTSVEDSGASSGEGSGGGQGGQASTTQSDSEQTWNDNLTDSDQDYINNLHNPDPQFSPKSPSDLANTDPSDLNKVVANAEKYGSKFLGINASDPLGSVIQKVGSAVLSSALSHGGGHATASGMIVNANGQPIAGPGGLPLQTGINPLTGLPFTNTIKFWYIGLGLLLALALTS